MNLVLPFAAALALLLALPAPAAADTLKPVTVARGLANPWALAFLPDGRMLVTERAGRLRIVEPGGRVGEPLPGLPPIATTGQCGLLDVVVHPEHAGNQLVFFTFAEPGENGTNGTAVGRAKLVGNRLVDVKTIFRQLPKVDSRLHCGSRLVFTREGHLFVGLGDRFSRKDDAQLPGNHIGKVVRIDTDGKAPPDNPFVGKADVPAAVGKADVPAAVGKADAVPELWSLGHRNIQGAALHPQTGELWASEHGPQGGDEINVVLGGRNYGWPLVTYGRNYGTGTRIGDEGPKPGYEQPLKHWVPTSIAPSGMAFLTSDRYPGWKGHLFIGALREQGLVRLALDGRSITGEERLLTTLGERIRDVRQGPDGWLYVLTDNADGRVIRLER